MKQTVFYVFYKLMNGPWPRDVCTLLSNYGFGEVFLNNEKVNIRVFGESVLTRYKEQQAGVIWTEPTLHAIRMRKFEYGTENTVV